MESLLAEPLLCAMFLEFLENEFCPENMHFLEELELFLDNPQVVLSLLPPPLCLPVSTNPPELFLDHPPQDELGWDIYDNFLVHGAPLELNVSASIYAEVKVSRKGLLQSRRREGASCLLCFLDVFGNTLALLLLIWIYSHCTTTHFFVSH